MHSISIFNLVIGAYGLLIIIRRQLTPQIVHLRIKMLMLLVLLGISSISTAIAKQPIQVISLRLITFGTLSLTGAILFGVLRARTYKFWIDSSGFVIREGSWLTLMWWIIGISTHLTIDQLWNDSSTTLLLYIGVTLCVQRGYVWRLATRAYPNEIRNNRLTYKREQHHHRHR